MKRINWDPEKNRKLIVERGISFEDVVYCLHSGGLLDDTVHANPPHRNPESSPHQRVLVVAIEGYAYLVPYVEDDQEIFLETVIPS